MAITIPVWCYGGAFNKIMVRCASHGACCGHPNEHFLDTLKSQYFSHRTVV